MVLKPTKPDKIITRLEERVAYAEPKNKWLTVFFDRVRFASGKEGFYNRVVFGQQPRPHTGASVLPVCGDKIGLIRLYRYSIGRMQWELPRGGLDEGDCLHTAAMRETLEEFGLAPNRLIDLGDVHPSGGMVDTCTRAFIGYYDEIIETDTQDYDEVSEIGWFTVDDVMQAIAGNEITDAYTLSILMLARAKGLI